MANIAVTGANGFIGTNFSLRAREQGHTVLPILRSSSEADRVAALACADIVFHLAGVNRPKTENEFTAGNKDATLALCDALRKSGRPLPLVLASSTQAALDNAYGLSKKAAEDAVLDYGRATGAPVHVFRLPNVFGKWCRPQYNSAVATFCYNITRKIPIQINDTAAALRLVYVDDVVDSFLSIVDEPTAGGGQAQIAPLYETTVGELVDTLRSFAEMRESMVVPAVGTGFLRALYSTYISYLPAEDFVYTVSRHDDPRGTFVEMLKTRESGQFSYFTARPGITRGGHYHHTKTEKFLVIKGTARFGFRQVATGETYELVTRGGEAQIVETVPGWTHDITNIGQDEMIVMLWANEIFDHERPDTIAMKVNP
ncbi:UDP-2-acetamido-2,6-beta-L-arabino-hexul-4-ose reductase [Paracidovorax wautersii]|uniref:UDP-2-acetamido-2,6-beta-L-arabino-hexul-4-ose reductase n=1 Tax=Paracidovorax wautersii TaxID=1177982 RepID=A0A1I2CK23_9BURK|nr:NAD-dependent epimerase/dehydratase family protein [Paracidovorax wautersii]SFE68502.1 UDP-2-acetamido-2,6-beta-L-arabino-hexul-4-ose reductase [Paracidovorax wautersii]